MSENLELALLRRDIKEANFRDLRLAIIIDENGTVEFAQLGTKIDVEPGGVLIAGLKPDARFSDMHGLFMLIDRAWAAIYKQLDIPDNVKKHQSFWWQLSQFILTGIRATFADQIDTKRFVVDDLQSCLLAMLDRCFTVKQANQAAPIKVVDGVIAKEEPREDPWIVVDRADLAISSRSTINEYFEKHPNLIRPHQTSRAVELRRSMLSIWVKQDQHKKYFAG